MRKWRWDGSHVLLIGLIAIGLVSCWRTEAVEVTQVEVVRQEDAVAERPIDARLISANTRFSFKLFSEVLEQSSRENVLVSPSSVALALGMTYNGASGETQQAMAQTLEVQDISLADLNQANAALIAALETADPAVQMAIANSLWSREGVALSPDFLQRNQDFYAAEVTSLDFADPNAPTQINDWVSEQTAGKIPEIVEQLDPQDVLFLINAVYFKGSWTQEFDPAQTSDRPFQLADGSPIQHPLMEQTGEYAYLETEQFQAIRLPYGQRRFSFYVFLPSSDSSLSDFQTTLTAENWETWMSQLRSRTGTIRLPRFQFEYSVGLRDALTRLGMELAFDPDRADFSALSPQPTYISDVRHKTYIEVNEEGTEAAAVTSVQMRTTSAVVETQPPFEMTVDRPFFCALRDDQTGAILFMGAIVDPQS